MGERTRYFLGAPPFAGGGSGGGKHICQRKTETKQRGADANQHVSNVNWETQIDLPTRGGFRLTHAGRFHSSDLNVH